MMKKVLALMALSVALLASCVKADIDPAYDMEKYPVNCSVIAAYCFPDKSPKATQVTGKISKEPDADGKYLIEFVIPRDTEAKYYDLTRLKIKINVDYDVYVNPPLAGVHDLDDKTEDITISTPLTREKKVYTLKAYKSRK